MSRLWVFVFSISVTLLWACSNDIGSKGDAEFEGWEREKAPPYVYPIEEMEANWDPCSLHEGANDGLAECATLEMPLFWDKLDDSRTIGIRAKRLLSEKKSEGQVWLLAGGPGQSGTVSLPEFMQDIMELNPAVDLYTIDHRGTGFSGRLDCPEAEETASIKGTYVSAEETPSCVEYLVDKWEDGLGAITTSNSAIDVAAFIEASREDGKRVFVYGGSYGTYWAQRYLQIFPNQADGAILEGIVPPDATFVWYDEKTNDVAHELMNLCGRDAFCSSKLGHDPWARLGALLENVDSGHCNIFGINKDLIRTMFAYLMYWNTTNLVIPAATYRLERCDADDRRAILKAYLYFLGPGSAWFLESYSILLQHHIVFSEMWDHADFDGVDLDEYFAEIYKDGYVIKNGGPTKLHLKANWPIYKDSLWDDRWAHTNIPVLMLQGRLDPATPIVEAVRVGKHYSGEYQYFVEFPHASHVIMGSTPTVDGNDCGYDIFNAFLKNPTGPLDTSCVESTKPVDFKGTPTLAETFFGTNDLWD